MLAPQGRRQVALTNALGTLVRRPGNLSLTAWKEYLIWLEEQPVTPSIETELSLARKIVADFQPFFPSE
jgi:hypothetical protein